jgi:hypothetical protein
MWMQLLADLLSQRGLFEEKNGLGQHIFQITFIRTTKLLSLGILHNPHVMIKF